MVVAHGEATPLDPKFLEGFWMLWRAFLGEDQKSPRKAKKIGVKAGEHMARVRHVPRYANSMDQIRSQNTLMAQKSRKMPWLTRGET